MEWNRSANLKGMLLAGCSVIALSAGEAKATVIYDCDGLLGPDVASNCTLEQLVESGGSIRVDDKLFDKWEVPNPFSTATGEGVAANPNNVTITGLAGVDPGLRFDLVGFFVSSEGGTQTSTFSFDVSVLEPGLFIHDNTLELLDSITEASGDETANAEVREVHAAIVGNPKQVFDRDSGSDSFDSRTFAPVTTLSVTTVIDISATGGAFAQVSSFEERFSQVPEPATLGLLGVGLGGLSLLRRRERKARA